VEPGFSPSTLEDLERRGHRITALPLGYMDFGCSQLILRMTDGYVAGCDPRRDSVAAGY
jgi:gamma-glutamyltranspeptidase / glutathione hydrolase